MLWCCYSVEWRVVPFIKAPGGLSRRGRPSLVQDQVGGRLRPGDVQVPLAARASDPSQRVHQHGELRGQGRAARRAPRTLLGSRPCCPARLVRPVHGPVCQVPTWDEEDAADGAIDDAARGPRRRDFQEFHVGRGELRRMQALLRTSHAAFSTRISGSSAVSMVFNSWFNVDIICEYRVSVPKYIYGFMDPCEIGTFT